MTKPKNRGPGEATKLGSAAATSSSMTAAGSVGAASSGREKAFSAVSKSARAATGRPANEARKAAASSAARRNRLLSSSICRRYPLVTPRRAGDPLRGPRDGAEHAPEAHLLSPPAIQLARGDRGACARARVGSQVRMHRRAAGWPPHSPTVAPRGSASVDRSSAGQAADNDGGRPPARGVIGRLIRFAPPARASAPFTSWTGGLPGRLRFGMA
jgi:hypothetical protein